MEPKYYAFRRGLNTPCSLSENMTGCLGHEVHQSAETNLTRSTLLIHADKRTPNSSVAATWCFSTSFTLPQHLGFIGDESISKKGELEVSECMYSISISVNKNIFKYNSLYRHKNKYIYIKTIYIYVIYVSRLLHIIFCILVYVFGTTCGIYMHGYGTTTTDATLKIARNFPKSSWV